MDGLSKCKVDPFGVCSLRAKAVSVLSARCCRWNHAGCSLGKLVTEKFSRNFACIKCEGSIGEAVEHEERLCDKVETIQESTYLVGSVSAGGGCEAAVTARTICGWVKLRECVELLYDSRFPLRLKWAVYESNVRPAILYGSEAWCLKESKMGILQRTD